LTARVIPLILGEPPSGGSPRQLGGSATWGSRSVPAAVAAGWSFRLARPVCRRTRGAGRGRGGPANAPTGRLTNVQVVTRPDG